ncbi:cation:dicarboxylate symporter family transporter [Candidatus Trichorickettsia mobilis]|uniref:cation:dicarboxylate symporter family transporter n=1 Tax=Candidatus Trichorickettsia mobilis TaxID=1346319 RepID=UPI0029300684|nr:cation:dicarboxylase symporter family transporter [Candidatus Trichorickettsia mobilis]
MKKAKFLFFTILSIIIPIFCSGFIPQKFILFSYTLSITIKSLIITILPFIIFCFIFCSLINLNAKKAIRFVFLLIGCVFISNLLGILTGYFIGRSLTYFIDIPPLELSTARTTLQPLWHFGFKPLIANEQALISGFILGIICSIYPSQKIYTLSKILNNISTNILKYFFIPILPIFILGSMFKLQHDGLLTEALHIYGKILFIVVSAQILYLTMLYLIASKFQLSLFLQYIKNILPATLIGFSTSSSASSLPILVMASEKNLGNELAARIIVPASINIHTLGSALAITILCMTTISAFGMEVPKFSEFYIFALFYAVSKFAVAGVPGGVILVVAPLIESYLHFSGDMLALITGIYVLFDPFGTAANVTGNGAFAIIFNKISKKFRSSVEQ